MTTTMRAGSYEMLLRIICLGVEADTFPHQLLSSIGQGFAPLGIKSPALPACTCMVLSVGGGVLG